MNYAPCGCMVVQCDNCAKKVPLAETVHGYGSGGETRQCAACTGNDPREMHPKCDVCGSCTECACQGEEEN